MDLNVSPDLDAYVCYAIVFALGAFTAVVQIRRRLGDISKQLGDVVGIWLMPRTWLLFLAYLAVPLALFWLLDRTSAITDTSLFAAVLVAVGYERIITGSGQTMRAPDDVSQWWTPFLAYADRVVQSVIQQNGRNQLRLAEKVIAAVVRVPQRYAALELLAMSRSPDVGGLQAQLATIDAGSATRGAENVLEQKARTLYAVMVAVPDGHYLMKGKQIISEWFYWFEVRRGGSMLRTGAIIVGLVGIAIAGIVHFSPNHRQGVADYYAWRIAKTNATTMDQSRARQNLIALMEDSAIQDHVTRRLLMSLRQPGLPMERVDLILQILLESRARPPGNPALPARLVQSLRTSSVDARSRVNDVLLFLAASCAGKPPDNVSPGRSSDAESTAALEERIKLWSEYWHDACQSKAA